MDDVFFARLRLVYLARLLEALEVAKSIRDDVPRVVFLYSAGKDSAAAMLPYLYEWFIDTQLGETLYDLASVPPIHVLHVVVTGNSHPANTYCAAASMLSTLKEMSLYAPELYEAQMLASPVPFQMYAAKYGLMIGARRWCWLRMKYEVMYNYLRELWERYHQPLIVVDGMAPGDRAQRKKLKHVEIVETSKGFAFVALHPLHGLEFDRLAFIEWFTKRHTVFRYYRCVVELYKAYGDSMNCVLCPYKTPKKLLEHVKIDPALRNALADFIEVALRSKRWQRYAEVLRKHDIPPCSCRNNTG